MLPTIDACTHALRTSPSPTSPWRTRRATTDRVRRPQCAGHRIRQRHRGPARWAVRDLGTVSTYALGAVYGLACCCSGPLLGSILTVAAVGSDPGYGAALLGAYAAGLAAPPFVLALLWDHLRLSRKPWLRGREVRIGPLQHPSTSLISGLLIIEIGLLYLLSDDTAGLVAPTAVDQQPTPRRPSATISAGCVRRDGPAGERADRPGRDGSATAAARLLRRRDTRAPDGERESDDARRHRAVVFAALVVPRLPVDREGARRGGGAEVAVEERDGARDLPVSSSHAVCEVRSTHASARARRPGDRGVGRRRPPGSTRPPTTIHTLGVPTSEQPGHPWARVARPLSIHFSRPVGGAQAPTVAAPIRPALGARCLLIGCRVHLSTSRR
ncbi:Cytochrome C biogenesis protein transmembrane region [Pseudonocardia ammonioxydans]|uniref:Cytochrome C biogenesis protein transmembrane region n=1 Tax=Pseudonocardia ammonioxydans TaxID=260086 RepID=A0A1I5IPN9_PSUAM|nr:Cytochrome C biogenesis protein transmembrane region [Pseudonocardia ammonioxydans]